MEGLIGEPTVITGGSFQDVWKLAVQALGDNSWSLRNLIVHIANTTALDGKFHNAICAYARRNHILPPKDVAYTIFPHKLYERMRSASRLYEAYNRIGGLYSRTQHRAHRWGTYFGRMTQYERGPHPVNQIDRIVKAIRERGSTHKAAYTIIIQHPGGETVQPLGGPCLNYIAVQLEKQKRRVLGLLAVYRNHDFLERAYGNYWGLCNLLSFLAKETKSDRGPLTCVSSRRMLTNIEPP